MSNRYSDHIYINIPRNEIAHFKFLLEAYDNLAYLSVIDRFKAVGKITFSSDLKSELLQVLQAMSQDIEFEIIDWRNTLCSG